LAGDQFPNFEQNATAWDLMVCFAGYHGIPKDEALKRTQDLSQKVNLAEFQKKKLRTYSQGMKNRFSLAVALLSRSEEFLFRRNLEWLRHAGHSLHALAHDRP
jgi:ABC-2 type transport system ATP-binding protein